MRSRHLPLALLLGLGAFILYALTAAPGLLYGDPGEFQFTLPLAGLSHPTGYPLFHILGWMWERPFGRNPALGANLYSAFWGGLAVAGFYLLSQEALNHLLARLKWERGARWLALILTLVFAANPSLWDQATHAEVYTMQTALVAFILAATLAAGRKHHPWPLWPLALGLGLGLAHHLTTLFLIPGILLYLVLARPQHLTPRSLLRALPWLLAPLLLYLYIPLRAPASPWLYPQLTPTHTLHLFDNTLAGNLRFILGIGYAQALGSVPLTQQLTTAAHLYLTHLTGIGLLLAGLGLLALILEGAWPLLGLTGLSFLLLQTFNLFYGIGDIATYYLPLYLILTLWLGFGLAYLVEGLTRITSPGWRRIWLALPLLILWIPITHGQTLLPQYLHQDRQQARARWETILQQPLAPQALLVSNDRDEMVPLIYLQQIEHRAPDMLGIFPLLDDTPDWADLNMTLKSGLATGRPLYLIKPMPGVQTLYQVQPIGGDVWQVLGPQPAPTPSFEAPYTPQLRWLGITWQGDPTPGATLQVTLYWRATAQPSTIWHSFLHLTDAQGQKITQAQDHRPGGDYLPSPLWRPGDVIADTFQLPLPPDLPPGDYPLLAGFYDPTTGQRIADPLEVAVLNITAPQP